MFFVWHTECGSACWALTATRGRKLLSARAAKQLAALVALAQMFVGPTAVKRVRVVQTDWAFVLIILLVTVGSVCAAFVGRCAAARAGTVLLAGGGGLRRARGSGSGS